MRRRSEPTPPPQPSPETASAPVIWRMAPDPTGSVRLDIADQLANIEQRVERIASDRPVGSDLNTLATAIHGLIDCVRELHRSP